MRNPFRALSVEPVEDRSLPSTLLFIEPGFSHRSQMAANEMASSAHLSHGWEQARMFQAEAFTERLVRVQFANDTILFIQDTPTGFRIIPVAVTVSTPAPVQGPTGDGGGSTGAGEGGGDTGSTGPVASPHGPARTGATSNPVTGTTDVAVAPATESANTSRAATADQAAAGAAAQVLVQNGPALAAQATPVATGHAAYAFTAITPEAEDGADDVVPPTNPDPMPGPAPTPVPDAGSESPVVQVAVAAVAPVAGMVPIDLSALSAGATQFLGRVADLAPVWPDAMPRFNDTLWVAAAALLTGGGVYAAGARSAAKPARDPLAGALSEWERRNGRVTG